MLEANNVSRPGLMLVANWDSNVGYAWWLMESYWIALANHYSENLSSYIVYPSISELPEAVKNSPATACEVDFSTFSLNVLMSQYRFIKKNNIEIIYFSDKPSFHFFYMLYRFFGVKKIISHDHTPGLRTTPKGLRRYLKLLLNRLPFIPVDTCIGATEFVRDRLVNVTCFPDSKCFTVRNGIPVSSSRKKDIYSEFNIDTDKKIIVTAARAARYKGIFFALEVLRVVKSMNGNAGWHYLFMGDGPDREAFIAKSQELGVADNVSFPGRIDGAADYFSSAYIAFHPSHGEVGYSLSILEYMFAGLPVVVPNNPSVSGATIHKKTGLIYSDQDVQSAAKYISDCLNNPEMVSAMGASAQEAVIQDYTLDSTHKQLIAVFSKQVL